jgi:hypothetical protein
VSVRATVPSIEDKIVRFADKTSHQIFVEPEGLTSAEVYPNGISTSLPYDVQEALVHSIPGFEQAHLTRPGYAIEYDFFDPRDLAPTLETRYLPGLFFAGQINGTTGYEEAAAQGLLAGLNAARQVLGQEPWSPRRDEAYLGVLVDDLITRGTSEPYRMFTSRAEYRLLLREDNADQRLTETGRRLGLVDDERWHRFAAKREAIRAGAPALARLPGAPEQRRRGADRAVHRPADPPRGARPGPACAARRDLCPAHRRGRHRRRLWRADGLAATAMPPNMTRRMPMTGDAVDVSMFGAAMPLPPPNSWRSRPSTPAMSTASATRSNANAGRRRRRCRQTSTMAMCVGCRPR